MAAGRPSAEPWQPWPEPELVPYQPWPLPQDGPWLVLAPHPDDEVLGCGGLLALACARSHPVQVVVVSDGGAGGDAPTRERESHAARAALAGAQAYRLDFWRLPDRGIVPDAPLVQRIVDAMTATAVRWLFAPSPFEVHPDHLALCIAATAAVAQVQATGGAQQLVYYEVGQPLLANRLLDITPVVDAKRRAIAVYQSQLVQQRYDDQLLGLNRYRAYTLGPQVRWAEAFWQVDRADLAGGIDGVLHAARRGLDRRCTGSSGSATP